VTDPLKPPRIHLLTSILLGALTSILAIFCYLSFFDSQQRSLALEKADDFLDETVTTLAQEEAVVTSLGQFVIGSERLNQEAFERYALPLLDRYRSLRSLVWLPRVAASERLRFEAEVARNSSQPNFSIYELDPAGNPKPADIRPEYYPAMYLAPLIANKFALGFDVANEQVRVQTIKTAFTSNRCAATPPLKLLKKPIENDPQLGLLIICPILQKRSAQSELVPLGIALGVVEIPTLLQQLTLKVFPSGPQLLMQQVKLSVDESAEDAPSSYRSNKFNITPNDRALFPSALSISTVFSFGQRNWNLSLPFQVMDSTLSLGWMGWSIAVFAFLFSLTLAYNVFGHLTRTRLIESEVAKRTLELRQASAAERKLRDELRAYQAELRDLALRLTKSEEYNRGALSTELHDCVVQLLAVCALRFDQLEKHYGTGSLSQDFAAVRNLIHTAIKELRIILSDLSPAPILELGLPEGLSWLTEQLRERYGLHCRISLPHEVPEMSKDLSIAIYQITRELLLNVIKHSGVLEAELSIRIASKDLELIVQDEGCGFSASPAPFGQVKSGGFGLFQIRERVASMLGGVKIESKHGFGTTICVRIPLEYYGRDQDGKRCIGG